MSIGMEEVIPVVDKPADGWFDWRQAYFAVGDRVKLQTRRLVGFQQEIEPAKVSHVIRNIAGRVSYTLVFDPPGAMRLGRRIKHFTARLEDLVPYDDVKGFMLHATQ